MTAPTEAPAPPTSRRAAIKRGLAFELGMYVSLARWIGRRPSLSGPSTETHGYARLITPMLWLWIAGSAIEIPAIHFILPWRTAQIVALVLGVWGLIWMLGMLASYRVHPHLLEPDRLRARNGARIDVAVPWSAIASVGTGERALESTARSLQAMQTDDGTHLRIGVGGQVNVHLTLAEPTQVQTPRGPMTITRLSLWADDPRDLARDIRGRLRPVLRGV